jgi:Ni,Fe-hydrogenase III small subunit
VAGGIDCAIPVDIYVPGCAARPEALLDAVVKLLGSLEQQQLDGQKRALEITPPKKPAEEVLYTPAYEPDPGRIMAWQQIAVLWSEMSEEDKNHAEKLWQAMPEEEKNAALEAAIPLIDGRIPYTVLKSMINELAAIDPSEPPNELPH